MSEEPTPEPDPPRNVIEAIAAIMREIPGIGRDSRSEQGYNYRGIESITRELQPLLGKYGVVFVPRVLARFTKDLTINSKPWTEEQLTVTYTVYGPGGLNDRIEVGPVVGLGRDNSDKGTNKSLTQAYKYALIQTFCIGDAKDDADQHKAAEADAPQRQVTPSAALSFRIKEESDDEARRLVGLFCDTNDIPRVPAKMTQDQIDRVNQYLDGLTGRVDPAEDGATGDGEAATGQIQASGPESAPVVPANQDSASGGDAGEKPPDAGERMRALVKAMKPAEVKQRLLDRGVGTDGTTEQLRNKLVLALIRDEIGDTP